MRGSTPRSNGYAPVVEARGTPTARVGRWPEVRELTARAGPVATVLLTTEGDVEQASAGSERRWRALRDQLVRQGADERALERVDPLVASAHERGACLAVVATADELRHVEHGPTAPPVDVGTWDELPAVAQLLRWRQEAPPYVVVVTDRRGADITAVARHGDAVERVVDGADDPLRKVAPGGWSQRRFQQRAENTWEANARDVAHEVERASDGVGAEVIVVAGDVRAVELLEKHLPERILHHIEEVAGGRSADGSAEEIDDAAHRWVRTAAARTTVELLEKFREERGQHDRAADGFEATVDALNRGQVDVLLVHDGTDDDRRLWGGRDAVPVVGDEHAARDLGVEEPRSGARFDVLVRAALGTGAGVWLVPRSGGPTDGVGAILRW
jgi:hypothetical protein